MHTDITDLDIQCYREDGFLAIPNLLNEDEVARLRRHTEKAEASMGADRVAGGPGYGEAEREAFVQKIHLWKVNSGVSAVVRHPELGRMVSRLEGVAGMRLWLDQSLCKRPWDSPTAFHLDNPFWSFTSRHACSVWIALDRATVGNGCLWYLGGTHRTADREKNSSTGQRLDTIFTAYPEWRTLEATPIELPAGGAVVHNGLTCHAAGPNLTPRLRRAVVGAYMPVGSTYNGRPDVLPKEYASNLKIGELLENETINPLVWREETLPPDRAPDGRQPRQR